ncbi:MAG: hypothetical protein ACXAEX_06220 [Promethearchaeota archaeon]
MKDSEDFYVRTDKPLSEHPKLITKFGNANSPDTIISTNKDTFTGVMCGRVPMGTLSPEDFKIEGDNTQAFIFFILMMITGQEFAELERQAEKRKSL